MLIHCIKRYLLISENALCLLPFNLPGSVHSMLITNPDYKTKSVLSAYHEPELSIWSKITGPSKFLTIKNQGYGKKEDEWTIFPWQVQKISPWTQIFHIKISFSQQAKFEILLLNIIPKLEIIKGTVWCLLKISLLI